MTIPSTGCASPSGYTCLACDMFWLNVTECQKCTGRVTAEQFAKALDAMDTAWKAKWAAADAAKEIFRLERDAARTALAAMHGSSEAVRPAQAINHAYGMHIVKRDPDCVVCRGLDEREALKARVHQLEQQLEEREARVVMLSKDLIAAREELKTVHNTNRHIIEKLQRQRTEHLHRLSELIDEVEATEADSENEHAGCLQHATRKLATLRGLW